MPLSLWITLAAAVVGIAAGFLIAHIRVGRVFAERDLARQERERAERELARLRIELASAQAARAAAEARAAQLAEMENAVTAAAQRALGDVGASLVQTNKAQVDGSLDTLLQPLREMVEKYRGELQQSERARNAVYGGLQQQIQSLLEAQAKAHAEASRLANALQSPTVRGSWGENSLKRCVELAGLSEFCDFDVQETFTTEEGKRLRPDLIVRLPNNRVIAVDAKVPLSEYQGAASESDESKKRQMLELHARTLRRHIDSLSRREYQASVGETLDFTVMFLPGEHFLSAALVTDPTLFEFAVDRKIYLASPTVLLPLLRAVAAGWKAERTEENAKKMHDAAVELFNRFAKVMDLISDVGASLAKTVEKYNAAIRSIDSRLWPKGEELQRLAGSGKDLGELKQLEAVPLESAKLKLRTQGEAEGEVVPFEGN